MCKCGGGTKLCPVSFGLAIGITLGLGMFIWSLWLMYYGISPTMGGAQFPVPTLEVAAVHSLWGLFKGFILGFFIALFYDWITCCCKKMACCRICKGGACSCSTDKGACACCSTGKQDVKSDTTVK